MVAKGFLPWPSLFWKPKNSSSVCTIFTFLSMNTLLGWIHATLPRFLSYFEKTSPHKRGGSFRPTHPSIFNTLLSASQPTSCTQTSFTSRKPRLYKKLPHENTPTNPPINHKNLSKSAFPNQPSTIKNSVVSRHWCMTPWFSCTKPGSGTMWVLCDQTRGSDVVNINSFP